MNRYISYALLMLCIAGETQAANLDEVRKQLNSAQQKSETIRRNVESAERELASIQKESKDIADALREKEDELNLLGAELQDLKAQESEKIAALGTRKRRVGAMVSTAVRLQQTPQMAVFFTRRDPGEVVQVSRTLGVTTQSLKKEMDALSGMLTEIRQLQEGIAVQTEKIKEKQDSLKDRREALMSKTTRRRQLIESLRGEDVSQQQRIAKLTRQAKDLEALVASLERARKAEMDQRFASIGAPLSKPGAPGKRVTPSPVARPSVKPPESSHFGEAKGNLRLPVAGMITGYYGAKRGSNDTLRGIEIATPAGAMVTAPSGGEVVFTGPFLDYGNMVIIRHDRTYHTLLAGMARVDAVPGQPVRHGEPLGTMGSADKEKKLYVELRRDSKAVDPMPWFKNTGTRLARK